MIQLSLQSATPSVSVSTATGIAGVSAVQLPLHAITHVATDTSPQTFAAELLVHTSLYVAGAPVSVSYALLTQTSVQSATPSSSASRSTENHNVSFEAFNVLKSKSIDVLDAKLALSPPSGPQNISKPITPGIVVLIEVNSHPQLTTNDP